MNIFLIYKIIFCFSSQVLVRKTSRVAHLIYDTLQNFLNHIEIQCFFGITNRTELINFTFISWLETLVYQKGNILLSWWAIAFYLLLPILIRSIVKFNTRRLLNEKLRLEKVVLERTKEVIRQKEEIISQRDALKKKSSELEDALGAISEQNRKLELLNATKDKFFSIVAHDIKSPLNSLSGFSDLLAKYTDALSPEEIKMVSYDLHKAVRNTFHLAENLLTWARAQMNGLNHYPQIISINDIINQNIELFETACQNKKVKIEKHLEDNLTAYADEDHIKFVIRNFLSNAIKFTGKGNGLIKVLAYCQKEMTVIEVCDNGIGMEKNQINNIFSIDSKCSTVGTAGEKGTGLGLLLCKEFINKNEGSIYMRSLLGEGSIFGITLLNCKAKVEPKKHQDIIKLPSQKNQ